MSTAAFRTTLATALALLAFAGSVSFADAKPNDGRFAKSSEAFKRSCNHEWNSLLNYEDEAEDRAEDGDMDGSLIYSQAADAVFSNAAKMGCGWAQ